MAKETIIAYIKKLICWKCPSCGHKNEDWDRWGQASMDDLECDKCGEVFEDWDIEE